MDKLKGVDIIFGCDPEFFFSREGKILGAEKVVPKEGFSSFGGYGTDGKPSKIIIDGVQAELNPSPSHCRANLANEISRCFRQLHDEIKNDKTLVVDFSPLVKVSKEEMDSLSEASKRFGCAPSNNFYDTTAKKSTIKVNPKIYRYRSAGGHIHLGVNQNDPKASSVLRDPKRITPLLDILVGNTCVLIDRDEGNIERRKVYGRAGETRSPAHGIEYRTLSNFWLRAYPLMSLAMGLARHAVAIVANSNDKNNYEKKLLSLVNMRSIRSAINRNSFDLAWRNFNKIEEFLMEITPGYSDSYPVNPKNINKFRHFVKMVKKNGLEYWFKEDPLRHWIHLPEGHGCGFGDFLNGAVAKDMAKGKK